VHRAPRRTLVPSAQETTHAQCERPGARHSPRLCGDIVHLSDPVTLIPGNDERWRFTLHRTDEPRSNVFGAVMLICDVTDLAFPGPDVSHWLEMEQLDALIDQLLIERNRARFLTAPTVHPARNSVERS
jgi:hypothetical protein